MKNKSLWTAIGLLAIPIAGYVTRRLTRKEQKGFNKEIGGYSVNLNVEKKKH